MDKPEIRALTGVRGMAACLVAIYHFSPTKDMAPGPLHNSVGRGYLWVDLFFVLSGFVIALNYGHLFASGFSRTAFATFLTRRVARIYPLYLAVLVAGLVWGWRRRTASTKPAMRPPPPPPTSFGRPPRIS